MQQALFHSSSSSTLLESPTPQQGEPRLSPPSHERAPLNSASLNSTTASSAHTTASTTGDRTPGQHESTATLLRVPHSYYMERVCQHWECDNLSECLVKTNKYKPSPSYPFFAVTSKKNKSTVSSPKKMACPAFSPPVSLSTSAYAFTTSSSSSAAAANPSTTLSSPQKRKSTSSTSRHRKPLLLSEDSLKLIPRISAIDDPEFVSSLSMSVAELETSLNNEEDDDDDDVDTNMKHDMHHRTMNSSIRSRKQYRNKFCL